MFSFVVFFLSSGTAVGGVRTEHFESSLPVEQKDIMQFTTEGHVLGFTPGKVYMVGLGYALIEEFVGASHVMPVAGESSKKSESSQDTSAKGSVAPPFQGVTYPGLWKGITVRYESARGGLAESTYVIQPGADPADIRVRYNADFSIDNDGGLRFQHPTKKGYYTLSRPIAWQDIGGRKIPVAVSFQDYGDRTLGFTVGARNPNYAFVIDPTYQWHTFYGSSAGNDIGNAIAVTADGVYVTGSSNATWNGDGETAPIHAYSADEDIVVLKLSTGGAYQWHTFYGSSLRDAAFAIAATTDGVYVTGVSNATWNGDGDTAPIHAYSGNQDIVVLKLSTAGAYQWHTFYGSSAGNDDGWGIAATTDGVYVTGTSRYYTWNGDGDTPPIHAFTVGYAIVVLKLSTAGAYQWHTFYGSSKVYANAIAVTADGVYVTGTGDATWNGDGDTPPIHAKSGSFYDIVVLKLSTAGAYQWHTFYGAGDSASGDGIAATTDGVYVSGRSNATWNGDGETAPIHAYSGSNDIVVLKLSTAGAYQWHTFYGSSNIDYGRGIAVVGNGVYVTGYGYATWNGDGNTPPIHAFTGSCDIEVLELDTSGVYQWHTFYGSANYASGLGIATRTGGIYVTGSSNATWNGDGNTSPIHAFSGSNDITILKLSNTYTVTYDGNGATGGSVPVDASSPYAQGATVTVLENTGSLVRTGFIFNGWNTAADGSGTPYSAADTFAMPPLDVTLYAQWLPIYPVTFDGNGATSGTKPADQTKTHGVDLTLATNTGSLEKTGYDFTGWNTNNDGSGTHYDAGGTYTDNAALNLYAEWTLKTYTVTYDGNGNTGGSVPLDASSPYAQSATVTVLGNTGSLVRTGFIFNGWNTAADGSGTPYSAADTFAMPPLDVTLYAQWVTSSVRHVCSDGNCGGKTPCHTTVSEAVQAAGTGTLIKIAAETHEGSFTLDADKLLILQGGWDASFNNPNGGTTTLLGAPKALQGSLTLQKFKIIPR